MESSDVRQAVALRFESLCRYPLFRGDEAARAKVRQGVEALETLHLVRDAQDVVAWLGWKDEAMSWCGGPLQSTYLHYRPGAVEAGRALIAEHADALGPHLDLHLMFDQLSMLPSLAERGIHPEALIVVGTPRQALTRLGDSGTNPATLGLDAHALRPEDVDSVVELQRRVFAAEPEHCHFGAHEAFLETQRKALSEGDGLHLVLRRGHDVVGHFTTDVRDDPFWGIKGAMALHLDASIRGRGLVRWAYRWLMERQVARGVHVFHGGTSRPEVMHHATALGATLCQVVVGRRHVHPPGHFGHWLGE